MTDIEKRAHDIAIAVLPHTLKEFEPDFTYLKKNHDDYEFRSYDVVEEYILLYEALLKDLAEYGGF